MRNFIVLLVLIQFQILTSMASVETDSLKQQKLPASNSTVFGNIYSAFYYGFNDNLKPKAAFEFTTGLIGISHKISHGVSATLIYDVTRTTNFNYADTSGISNYFEGSKYTAFLKMAEIKWDINSILTFRVGQLLNTQYLTFTDKFWEYRYIDVTFQEKYRFGAPADFGAQLDFHFGDKLLNQISVVNGEGPFKYQDKDAQFIFSNNIQFTPLEGMTLKLYVDYGPTIDTSSTAADRSATSLFFAYQKNGLKFGAEYNLVNNYAWLNNLNYSGVSLYSGLSLDEKNTILARYDFIKKAAGIMDGHYLIAGYQYLPSKNFTTSINIRYRLPEEIVQLYFSFGIKF